MGVYWRADSRNFALGRLVNLLSYWYCIPLIIQYIESDDGKKRAHYSG